MSETAGRVADATGNWVDRPRPPPAPYLRLSRSDRPIGAWLLLMPCWWSAAIAAILGRTSGSPWMWCCAIGAFVMRGAGAPGTTSPTANRRQGRPHPLAPHTLGPGQPHPGRSLPHPQALSGLPVLVELNPFAIVTGVASLAIVATIPSSNASPSGRRSCSAWPSTGARCSGGPPPPGLTSPLLLYAAAIAWALFYDTIYAHQDREDDAHDRQSAPTPHCPDEMRRE